MEIKLRSRYEGGVFDDGLSELYDGTTSLIGFCRVIAISIHMLANEEVIHRATALKGAKLYRRAAKKGSFVDEIIIVLDNPVVANIGYSVAAAAVYDFIKYSLNKAMGKNVAPETPYVKRMCKRIEPTVDRFEDSLRGPLIDMHRPIRNNSDVYINIERPKGPIVRMDLETLAYLSKDRRESLVLEPCNVTKFNILTGYGKIYLDREERVVSFNTNSNIDQDEKFKITKSMDDAFNDKGGKILIDGVAILDEVGRVKSVTINSVT
ncbi:hypothetical protein [Cobetia sp. 5-25-4-2]|uniref:DUF7946 domain-containing protein n=1 Tax=Cobetia sp. 5-25-4-2 TaxID=2737459 RepID=UPI001596C910|nr:hypothetical protein [Cobetia sp. 5-25-4-2]